MERQVSQRVGMKTKSRGRNEIPEKKRGRPCLLSDELDKQVQSYLLQLRDNGSVVNTNVAIACALGLYSETSRQ